MKIFEAFKTGLALVTHHRKMVGVIYGVNLVIGLIFAVPLFILFHGRFGDQVMRDDIVADFSYSWWSAFNFDARGLEETIRPSLSGGFGPLFDNLELLLTGQFTTFGWTILAIAVVYLFLAAFFNGGAIALFADERKTFTAQRFFSNAGLYFHHMAALAATAIGLFALVYKAINPLIFAIVDGIAGETLSQPFAWTINLFGYLVVLAVVFMFTLILDYAKLIVIAEKKESSWLCIWLALKFMLRNFGKTIGLNLLLVAFAAALVLLGGLLIEIVKPTQTILLILVTLIQQIYILLKIGARLTFYAAETVLYQNLAAAEAQVKKRKR